MSSIHKKKKKKTSGSLNEAQNGCEVESEKESRTED